MPQPTLVSTGATTAGSTASATPSIAMPTSSEKFAVLMAFVRIAGAGAIGWPAGWVEVFDEAADASDDQYAFAWKYADGTEGGTSISLTSANQKYAGVSWCWRNAGEPQVGPRGTGTSTTPDPPNFNFPNGSIDCVTLWFGSWEGEQTSPPASTPTGYLGAFGSNSGTAGAVTTNVRVATARKQLGIASSEDAGSWTISASDDWVAFTVALPWHPPNLAQVGMPQGLGASY